VRQRPIIVPPRDQRPHRNLKDVAVDHIRDEIVSGRFAPSSRLDIESIAETLGISRVPVREALIELAQKDFIVALPRRGSFVREVSVQDIEDHYEVVALVFGVAARRAADAIRPERIAELQRLHDEISSTTDVARSEQLDVQFLTAIARSGRSHRLDSVLRFLGGALDGRFYVQWPGWAANEARYRAAVLGAFRRHDALAAGRITEEHLRGCIAPTIATMRDRGYWSA
jgi:DNA-binding GntR family transcriptional regulator